MMTERGPIQKFEDILAWKHARALAKLVYAACLEPRISRDFGFVDQIRRASVSVMNNIAEGYERDTNAEFLRFLSIAKGSAGEVRSMLYLGLDAGYLGGDSFSAIKAQVDETIRVIVGLQRSIERRAKQGT